MSKIVIPYIGIEQIKKFIREMPKEASKLEDLINKFGQSNVANALPTLKLLKLVNYDKKEKIVSLSEIGRRFRTAIISGDYIRAREILKQVVDEIEIFSFIRGLLERRGSLSSKEIGREIAFKYGKSWKDSRTYNAYGAACGSILGFVGYGIYEKGVLRREGPPIRKEKKLPSPYLTFDKILRILEEIGYEEMDLHTLSRNLKTSINRLGSELSVCVELGVIERVAPGKFILTKKGERLIDPLNKSRRSEIWREILLNSRYRKIINLLKESEFNKEELGKILKHHLGGKWREEKTITTFAKKFWNWLKSADLLESTDSGKFKIREQLKISSTLPRKVIIPIGITTYDLYFLGKDIGIILSSKNAREIERAVEEIISICKYDKELQDIVTLLDEHLKLFKEMKLDDGRIFIPDIKLLEKRLGVEKWNIESIK